MTGFRCKIAKTISLCSTAFLLISLTPSVDTPLLKRVQEYWKEGDFSLAKKQILQYLEKNPSTSVEEELRLLLGDIYVQEGNFHTALEEYKKITKDELKNKTLYNLAICLYEEKKVEELLTLAKETDAYPTLSKEQSLSIHYLAASLALESADFAALPDVEKLFLSCLGTDFEKNALSSLIAVYLQQDNKEKAAICYENLAKLSPETKDDLLFSAAVLFGKIRAEKALSLFQQVIDLEKAHLAEAAYNMISLHYAAKNFTQATVAYDTYKHLLTPPLAAKAALLTAKSFYYLEAYPQSANLLLSIIAQEGEEKDETVVLMAFESAYKSKDLGLYENLLKNYRELLSTNHLKQVDLGYILLLRTSYKTEDLLLATKSFLSRYEDSAEYERMLVDYINLLQEVKDWKEAESYILSFMDKYPTSSFSSELRRAQVNCASALLQESSEEALVTARAYWITVLENALIDPSVFSPEEKKNYLSQLAKCLFLQQEYEKAALCVKNIFTQYPDISSDLDLQMLITLSYLNQPNTKSLFTSSAENLLSIYPDIPAIERLRIDLFNTYLKLADSCYPTERKALLDQAASHLYIIFEKKLETIEKQSLAWLGHHYYEKALENDLTAQGKAIAIFENLLSYDEETAITEMYVYKLSKIFSLAGLREKNITLLEEWIPSHSGIITPLQKHLLFTLAENHKDLAHFDRAIALYDAVIRSGETSYLGVASALERTKLLLHRLSPSELSEENPICLALLENLKEIEARRNPLSEPLHLEAGLEYALSKGALAENDEQKKEKTRKLLTLFQENFRSAEEYDLSSLKEKRLIFEAYMQFAEAEISHCLRSCDEEDVSYIAILLQLKGCESTPEPLKQRIATILQEI